MIPAAEPRDLTEAGPASAGPASLFWRAGSPRADAGETSLWEGRQAFQESLLGPGRRKHAAHATRLTGRSPARECSRKCHWPGYPFSDVPPRSAAAGRRGREKPRRPARAGVSWSSSMSSTKTLQHQERLDGVLVYQLEESSPTGAILVDIQAHTPTSRHRQPGSVAGRCSRW